VARTNRQVQSSREQEGSGADQTIGPVLDLPERITPEHAARVVSAIARLLARQVLEEILEEEARARGQGDVVEKKKRGRRRAPSPPGGV
jgi:hypothetical protein